MGLKCPGRQSQIGSSLRRHYSVCVQWVVWSAQRKTQFCHESYHLSSQFLTMRSLNSKLSWRLVGTLNGRANIQTLSKPSSTTLSQASATNRPKSFKHPHWLSGSWERTAKSSLAATLSNCINSTRACLTSSNRLVKRKLLKVLQL